MCNNQSQENQSKRNLPQSSFFLKPKTKGKNSTKMNHFHFAKRGLQGG